MTAFAWGALALGAMFILMLAFATLGYFRDWLDR